MAKGQQTFSVSEPSLDSCQMVAGVYQLRAVGKIICSIIIIWTCSHESTAWVGRPALLEYWQPKSELWPSLSYLAQSLFCVLAAGKPSKSDFSRLSNAWSQSMSDENWYSLISMDCSQTEPVRGWEWNRSVSLITCWTNIIVHLCLVKGDTNAWQVVLNYTIKIARLFSKFELFYEWFRGRGEIGKDCSGNGWEWD